MKFITVTTKDVGADGKPKLFMINIAHIVTCEPARWVTNSIDLDGANQDVVQGTSIIVSVNAAHIIEVESRDPFDHVLKRIEMADGTVQNIDSNPLPPLDTRTDQEKLDDWGPLG